MLIKVLRVPIAVSTCNVFLDVANFVMMFIFITSLPVCGVVSHNYTPGIISAIVACLGVNHSEISRSSGVAGQLDSFHGWIRSRPLII